MSENQKEYHVVRLTPHMQATLRIVLNNFVKLRIKSVTKHMKSLTHDQFFDAYESCQKKILKHIDEHEFIIEHLNMDVTSKSKDEIMFYTKNNMKYVLSALQSWDLVNNMGYDDDDCYFVTQNINSVKELFQKSSEFTYTLEEIKAAQK